MSVICLKIFNKEGKILAEESGINEINLVYQAEYQEGDRIVLDVEDKNTFYYVQFDDARGKAYVYLTGIVDYKIPFGDDRMHFSPKAFFGEKHVLSVRKASEEEQENYRNLAENIWDFKGSINCYPHASSNVENRAAFDAMNAIDGVTVTTCHGRWPYQSWGIGRRADAVWKLEFGRAVDIEKLVFYCRADFPHDSWWKEATLMYSDGSTEKRHLIKSKDAQIFEVKKNKIEWIEIKELIKADDQSPFPALTQLQVYGRG